MLTLVPHGVRAANSDVGPFDGAAIRIFNFFHDAPQTLPFGIYIAYKVFECL